MLKLKISDNSLKMKVNDSTINMQVENVRKVYGEISDYIGDYVIEPDKDAQTLETKDRRMLDDVSILAIPRHNVSNTDGTTVIIGGVPYYGEQ